MKQFFITSALLLTLLLPGTEIDLLKNFPGTGDDDVYHLGEMLVKHNDGYIWNVPKGNLYNRILLGSFKAEPCKRYVLSAEMMPAMFLKLLFLATFEDAEGKQGSLWHLMTYENSSAFGGISKEIITPPGTRSMTLWLYLSGNALKMDSNIGFIRSMKLSGPDPLPFYPELKKLYGENLLPYGNFEQFQLGTQTVQSLRLMPFPQKAYGMEIVKDQDGHNVLKLNHAPQDAQYAVWFTEKLPLYNTAGIMKCRMRGKGRAQLMLGYGRHMGTVWKHFGFFELTPEWREYTVPFVCDDPMTWRLGATVAFKPEEATAELSDISLILCDPDK